MFFNKGGISWLVVFLGNPGTKYAYTRHNAGFMVAEEFERSMDIKINKIKYKSLTQKVKIGNDDVLFMMPQTYMNLSGEAVIQAAQFYKVPSEHIIVVSDEMALDIGSIRIRKSGSAGGHNGLKNIIQHLGTNEFPRIRIGVGTVPHPDYDVADWVLSTFRGEDLKLMQETCKTASKAIECYIKEGADRSMTKYNTKKVKNEK